MSSKGTLKLGAALMQLHDARASGIVRFERGKAKKQLLLRGGRVAFGESNQPEEHLVRTLIRLGLLPRAALGEVTRLMKSGMAADAAVLASGEADAEAIRTAVRDQATDIVASLLGWEDVNVRYYSGSDLLNREVDAGIDIPELLAQAARRSAPARLTPGLPRGVISFAPGAMTLAMKLPLDGAEAYACSLVSQPVAIRDFLNLMPAGEASPGEILLRLLLLGLVSVQRAEADARVAPDGSAAARIEETLSRFEVADYYGILSVPADAGQEAIKSAYHELARQYHPDLFQGERFDAGLRQQVETLFTYITAAYTTLGDAASRAAYDQQRLVGGSKLGAALQARAGADLDREKSALALFRVGQEALAAKDFEKAVLSIGECVLLKPDVAKYRQALASAQMEIPRHRKAAEQNLLKAIELDPIALESHVMLGKLYLRVNLPRRAEAQFKHTLQLDPGNRQAEKGLKAISQSTVRPR